MRTALLAVTAATVLSGAQFGLAIEWTKNTQVGPIGSGHAIILNNCEKPVTVISVPEPDPVNVGYTAETTHVVQPSTTFSTQWISLISGGWSLKCYPAGSSMDWEAPVMQYEYGTFNSNFSQWWDMSSVNGNPFKGNWALSVSNEPTCIPKNTAYACSTDDKAMQDPCTLNADITLTLCAADPSSFSIGGDAPGSGNNALACGPGGSLSTLLGSYGVTSAQGQSAASPATTLATSVSQAPGTSSPADTKPPVQHDVVENPAAASSAPSSATTVVPPATTGQIVNEENVQAQEPTQTQPTQTQQTQQAGDVVTVMHVETATVVVPVVETVYAKRHAHHRRAL